MNHKLGFGLRILLQTHQSVTRRGLDRPCLYHHMPSPKNNFGMSCHDLDPSHGMTCHSIPCYLWLSCHDLALNTMIYNAWLMKPWFESSNHAEPYNLDRNTTVIDRVLMQQHRPHEFSCCPRSIAKHLKFWKPSELKNWPLFYSLPLLLDYLPSHHYTLIVCAMHILLQESIDSSLLDAAEMMLKDYFLNFMENVIAQPMHTCCCIYLNTLDCVAF